MSKPRDARAEYRKVQIYRASLNHGDMRAERRKVAAYRMALENQDRVQQYLLENPTGAIVASIVIGAIGLVSIASNLL